jgi:nucleoid-associated protein YgaU
MSRTIKHVLLGALIALVLVTPFAPAIHAQTTECQQTYTVSAGDWLSTIAEKYLGSIEAYTAIFEATNQAAETDSSFATLTDPNRIDVGQKLCIPAITAVPGRESAGIYTSVGPAADASALVETIVLGGDGQVFYTMNYVGKAEIVYRGTWSQEGDTVTVQLTQQGEEPYQQTMTFTVTDGNLVSTTPPNQVYTKTSASVAFYSGVYTSGRSTQDGSETLTALTLLPNGEAQMTLSTPDNPFILQTGTWTVGPNPDTGAESVTVHLTQQGDQTIDETYVFQVQGNLLRGTEYNRDKWGTDLTFTKVEEPAQPETPGTVSMTATAEAAGQPTPEATATIQAGETVTATVEATETVTATATVESTPEPTATEVTTTTQTIDASFGGVTFSFSSDLAQSAEGSETAAIPVSEGPSLGGAMPASVRFMFNGEAPPDFVGPLTAQVVVYKAEDWVSLDSSTATTVADLQSLLATKPADFAETIPVLPPVNAAQVFHVQNKYLEFENGSGVAFVGYYAQDVAPVTADSIFYSFQGLTDNGKYYVVVFYPVTTSMLPADFQTALGSMTDEQWAAQYNDYLAKLTTDLDALESSDFTPDLSWLDDLVTSINVSDTTLE